jgi:hypothetical protein
MAQAVSCRSFITKACVHAQVNPCGICDIQTGIGTGFFSEFFGIFLSVSFHCGSPHLHITWGMNNRPVSGRSSEAWFHPIDMNTKMNEGKPAEYNYQKRKTFEEGSNRQGKNEKEEKKVKCNKNSRGDKLTLQPKYI